MARSGVMAVGEFLAAAELRYTSVGCYQLFFLMADGSTIHPKCAHENRERIVEVLLDHAMGKWSPKDWLPSCMDVNWEDGELRCDECNELIESAYAEPEEDDHE